MPMLMPLTTIFYCGVKGMYLVNGLFLYIVFFVISFESLITMLLL